MVSNNIAAVLSSNASAVLSGGNAAPSPSSILGAAYFGDWDLAANGVAVSGGVVTSVPNQGLEGTPIVVGPGTGGTWEPAGLSGKPSMLFNATDTSQAMSCTFASPIAAGSRVFVWAVMQCPSLPGGTGIAFDLQSADGSRALLYYVFNSSGWAVLSTMNGAAYVTGNPLVAFDTSPHLYELGNPASGLAAYGLDTVSGNLAGAAAVAVNDVPLTRLLLTGYGNTTDQRARVRIARMVIANAEPSAPQRAAMRDYFKRTYPSLNL